MREEFTGEIAESVLPVGILDDIDENSDSVKASRNRSLEFWIFLPPKRIRFLFLLFNLLHHIPSQIC